MIPLNCCSFFWFLEDNLFVAFLVLPFLLHSTRRGKSTSQLSTASHFIDFVKVNYSFTLSLCTKKYSNINFIYIYSAGSVIGRSIGEYKKTVLYSGQREQGTSGSTWGIRHNRQSCTQMWFPIASSGCLFQVSQSIPDSFLNGLWICMAVYKLCNLWIGTGEAVKCYGQPLYFLCL